MSAHYINFTWNYASILIPYYVSLGTTTKQYHKHILNLYSYNLAHISIVYTSFLFITNVDPVKAYHYVSNLGASSNYKHTICYAYLNYEYRSCLYLLSQLGVIYATQIFFNNPYVSNLGAHSVLEHYANWTSSLAIEKYSFLISYQLSGHIDYGFQLSIRNVSLGARNWTNIDRIILSSFSTTQILILLGRYANPFSFRYWPLNITYYVSNLGATIWLLTSSIYSTPYLICYIGLCGAFDNWNPFYEFYVSLLK